MAESLGHSLPVFRGGSAVGKRGKIFWHSSVDYGHRDKDMANVGHLIRGNKMNYILTTEEANEYDRGDDIVIEELGRSLRDRFGGVTNSEFGEGRTGIYHPDGFLIECRVRHKARN